MASTLPSEVVLHILNFNLPPRSLRTRTAHLLTYCLLNRHFQSYYQPQLLEHLHLEGSGLRIGMQLGVIRYLLAVGGEKARLGVRTITCSLTPGLEEVSYTLLRTVNMCERVTELVLERMVEVDLSSMLSKLPHLRVLHLLSCIVDEWPESDASDSEPGATNSLQYLYLERTQFPSSVSLHLTNLKSLSDHTGDFGWKELIDQYPPSSPSILAGAHLESIQLPYSLWQELGQHRPQFLNESNITSLEIIDCPNLEKMWSSSPIFDRLVRLNIAATPANLRFLTMKLQNGLLRLEYLRFSLDFQHLLPRKGAEEEKNWKLLRNDLIKVAYKLRDRLDVRFVKKDETPVGFWETCHREEFELKGSYREKFRLL